MRIGEQDRNPQPPRPESRRGSLFGRRGEDSLRLGLNLGLGGSGIDELEDFCSRREVALLAEEPAGAFGKEETEQGIEERRKGGHAQHPAPCVLPNPGQERVGQVGDEDAKDDVELKQAGQKSPAPGRRDFGDVKRGRDGGGANAQTADGARDDEKINIGREGGPTPPTK